MREELEGRSASDGIGVGTVWFPGQRVEEALAKYRGKDSGHACETLEKAMVSVAARLNFRAEEAAERGETEQAEVLEAHAMIATDPLLRENAEKYIAGGMDAPHALFRAAEELAEVLSSLEDEYLRERAQDVRQAARAVISEICGITPLPMPPGQIVLAGTDIEPEQLAAVPKERLAGILVCGGTPLSHACIFSRARGIPAVLLPAETFAELLTGAEVLVDGSRGIVVREPADGERSAARGRRVFDSCASEPAVTADGYEVTLRANVGDAEEAADSQKKGASGVGLLRSEFLFMGRRSLPTEEEQYEAYRSAVLACGKAPCIIRTLDVGGDKPIPSFLLPKEKNPFLGLRGIRALLQNEEVFRTQLRALLRAAAAGHCAVMLPMITNAAEIESVRAMAEKELIVLQNEGIQAELPNIGIMIETPAAALLANVLTKHAGFFSIGTNDLTQYTLAADRTNEAVTEIGDALHPAVLQLIRRAVRAANAAGIPVTICGEIAADPVAAPVLAAMGRVALSMGTGALPRVRKALQAVSRKEAEEKLETALLMEDAKAVREFLQ